MALPRKVFVELMTAISRKLIEDYEGTKILCGAFLQKDILKKINNLQELSSELYASAVINEENLQELERLLVERNQCDLVKRVQDTRAQYCQVPESLKPSKMLTLNTDLRNFYQVSWSVVCGDIFSQNTDAIVVSTFSFGLGIEALHRGGPLTRIEYSQPSNQVVNYVVMTTGGDLNCKYIAHIQRPRLIDILEFRSVLTRSVNESLQSCEKHGCESVTIPLLFSCMWQENIHTYMNISPTCAKIIVVTVLDYFEQMAGRSNIKEIKFIDWNMQKAVYFMEALENGIIEKKATPYQTPTQLLCEYTYPESQTRLIVATGDPMRQPADVLVNPSANFMVAYSGLTAAILIEAALPTEVIQKAFENLRETNVVVTSAGKLPFKHLYHVRGNDELAKDYTQQSLQIETCTYDCLMMAEQAGMETVVLPVISNRYTTIGQYQCSFLMLDAIHRFATSTRRRSLKELYLYTGYPSNAFYLKDELIMYYGYNVMDIKGEVPLEVLARGLEANIAFIDAIKEGSKSIYQTRLMLVGPERVGKTSLTKALTNQKFDPEEGITDGIEASLSCTLSVKHTTNWKPKPTDGLGEAKQQYLRAVAERIAAKLMKKRDGNKSGFKLQAVHTSINDELKRIQSGKHEGVGNPENLSSEQSHQKSTAKSSRPSDDAVDASMTASSNKDLTTPTTPDVPEEVIQLVLEILKEKEKRGENLEESVDDLTLSIWDFAGQDVYYVTHQVFLVSRAVYIICFNLCHDLNAPAKVQVFKREGGKVSVTEHHMSYLDFIIFWLRSIYSNTTENPSGSKQEQLSPPVFIAGTHRESLPGNAEEQWALAEKKLATIKEVLKGTPYEGHVVSKYYAIDNSLRSPLDQSIIELRDHITEVTRLEHYMGQKIPLKWLDFLNEIELLRNQQKHSINFKEVSELAAKCGVVKEMQLFTLLHFYHDLGNIIYYGERDTPNSALNNIIILSPQWLICIFSRVITVKNPSEKWAKFASSWARLDKEGLLEERLIRHMWRDFLDLFEGLLQLMQKFDLLCVKTSAEVPPEEGDRLFYAPSLLKKQSDDMICVDGLVKSESVAMLYIDFSGFLPEGLFHRLLVQLVQWSQSVGGEPSLFYQQASLYVDDDHNMVIRILPCDRSYIQVLIKRANSVGSDTIEPCPDACKMMIEVLRKKLFDLSRRGMKPIVFDFCVLCDVCNKDHFHKLQKCLIKSRVQCGLERMDTSRFQRLFGDCKAKPEAPKPTPVVNVPPFLPDLIRVFNEISSPILPFDLMTEICVLLDPMHPLSNDWRGLACKLGYDRYINYLAMKDSPTMCMMNGWSEKGWTLQDFKQCMIGMNRHDVIRLLDKHLPITEE